MSESIFERITLAKCVDDIEDEPLEVSYTLCGEKMNREELREVFVALAAEFPEMTRARDIFRLNEVGLYISRLEHNTADFCAKLRQLNGG